MQNERMYRNSNHCLMMLIMIGESYLGSKILLVNAMEMQNFVWMTCSIWKLIESKTTSLCNSEYKITSRISFYKPNSTPLIPYLGLVQV